MILVSSNSSTYSVNQEDKEDDWLEDTVAVEAAGLSIFPLSAASPQHLPSVIYISSNSSTYSGNQEEDEEEESKAGEEGEEGEEDEQQLAVSAVIVMNGSGSTILPTSQPKVIYVPSGTMDCDKPSAEDRPPPPIDIPAFSNGTKG